MHNIYIQFPLKILKRYPISISNIHYHFAIREKQLKFQLFEQNPSLLLLREQVSALEYSPNYSSSWYTLLNKSIVCSIILRHFRTEPTVRSVVCYIDVFFLFERKQLTISQNLPCFSIFSPQTPFMWGGRMFPKNEEFQIHSILFITAHTLKTTKLKTRCYQKEVRKSSS